MDTQTKSDRIMELLPKLDCGACGSKTCEDFVTVVEQDENELKKCIHITGKINPDNITKNAIDRIAKSHEGLGAKVGWKDSLQRDFDFVLANGNVMRLSCYTLRCCYRC